MASTEGADAGPSPEAIAALGAQLGRTLATGLDSYARTAYGALSLADAVRAAVPDAEVLIASGCGVFDTERTDFDAAVVAAETADVVILALGGPPGWFGTKLTEGEGSDRADVGLPRKQLDLARAIAALAKPIAGVVFVFTGRPFAFEALDDLLPAIMYPSYGGQSAMSALAEVLFGDVSPSGKLPSSIARHSGQVPVHHGQHLVPGYRRTSADAHKVYTDMSSRPLYPFGHGLSYTDFEYSDFAIEALQISTDGIVAASVKISNTGDRPGVETVQFYAAHLAALVTRPARELVGFLRVELEPGESAIVDIEFSTGQLAYLAAGTFVFDPGALTVSVGTSSDELKGELMIDVHGAVTDWSRQRPLFAHVSRR